MANKDKIINIHRGLIILAIVVFSGLIGEFIYESKQQVYGSMEGVSLNSEGLVWNSFTETIEEEDKFLVKCNLPDSDKESINISF